MPAGVQCSLMWVDSKNSSQIQCVICIGVDALEIICSVDYLFKDKLDVDIEVGKGIRCI